MLDNAEGFLKGLGNGILDGDKFKKNTTILLMMQKQ